MGVLFSPIGNHKFLLRAPTSDFFNIQYARDSKQFIKEYKSRWDTSPSYVPIGKLFIFLSFIAFNAHIKTYPVPSE